MKAWSGLAGWLITCPNVCDGKRMWLPVAQCECVRVCVPVHPSVRPSICLWLPQEQLGRKTYKPCWSSQLAPVQTCSMSNISEGRFFVCLFYPPVQLYYLKTLSLPDHYSNWKKSGLDSQVVKIMKTQSGCFNTLSKTSQTCGNLTLGKLGVWGTLHSPLPTFYHNSLSP